MPTRQSGAVPAHPQNTLTLTSDVPPDMYVRESLLDGRTKHSRHCKATFGRRDWRCHRCCELMVEGAPRNGWQHAYFAKRLNRLQRKFEW